jgi:hypothetical protein
LSEKKRSGCNGKATRSGCIMLFVCYARVKFISCLRAEVLRRAVDKFSLQQLTEVEAGFVEILRSFAITKIF